MLKRIIYYDDELNDDFAGINRKKKVITADYKYINKNFLWNLIAFFIYRVIMTPIAFFYCKIKFGVKIKNRKVFRKSKKSGYFLYGNHTQVPGDGYFPSLISFPKKSYVIVNADSVALKFTEQFMLMIGAMPLPQTIEGTRRFMESIEKRLETKKCVTIYPEAHIWPYYTGIRPFSSTSFMYPIKFSKPSFAFTVTYQKRRLRKTPRVVVYIDGPFYPDKNLIGKEQKQGLRNEIYQAMITRAQNNNYEFIKYEKRDTR